VNNSTVFRNRLEGTLREKLFGYKSVNFLNPQLFKQFGEFYPLQLQDFDLTFQKTDDFSQLINYQQAKDLAPVNTIVIKNMSHVNPIIYVRSRDGANQNEKELHKMNYLSPDISRFVKVTSHAQDTVGNITTIKISCSCAKPIPEFFFIYSERLGNNVFEKFENQPPKIKSVEISRNQQKVRIYSNESSFYGLSKADILDCTRRNSHPRTDQKQLYEEFGALLLSRYDVGTLMEEQFESKLLEIDFSITLDLEPNTEVVVGGNDAAVNARYNNRIQQDTQTTVLFLYPDGIQLQGDARKSEFKKMMY
jgi:hypothetical protein